LKFFSVENRTIELLWFLILPWLLTACVGDTKHHRETIGTSAIEVNVGTANNPGPTTLSGTDEDWEILKDKVRWAYKNGIDTLPIGKIMIHIGQQFLGTPYAPYTLETKGNENLVIEAQELDCVTFVENVLALAIFVRNFPEIILEDQMVDYQANYSEILQKIRYRNGDIKGYPSRLHYFSEWIIDNDAIGMVQNLSHELGGVADHDSIYFMTAHPDGYRQLKENPSLITIMENVEAELSKNSRYYIPQEQIVNISSSIQDGDIIAATSTIAGLDVAHTGIALWRNDDLYLMHAPLIGGVVQISELPLVERIKNIKSQDGIMVARPLDP
tara:strand:- start:5342 stop:6328 length:987 start_codon:yes stop_codon:yes gene_type:complete